MRLLDEYTASEIRARAGRGSRPGITTQAFTIVELMAVILVILLLVGAIMGVVSYTFTFTKTSRARAEIEALSLALEAYRDDRGGYPLSTASRSSASANAALLHAALTNMSSGGRPYYTIKPYQIKLSGTGTNFLCDPFGSPYNYFRRDPATTTQVNRVTFDLWSYGPDGVSNTTTDRDDIVNWRQ